MVYIETSSFSWWWLGHANEKTLWSPHSSPWTTFSLSESWGTICHILVLTWTIILLSDSWNSKVKTVCSDTMWTILFWVVNTSEESWHLQLDVSISMLWSSSSLWFTVKNFTNRLIFVFILLTIDLYHTPAIFVIFPAYTMTMIALILIS